LRIKSEMDAKVSSLTDQMKQASDQQKAKIQKRIADAKAHYDARSGKLQKALDLAKEALHA
jgi:hypothetical protein